MTNCPRCQAAVERCESLSLLDYVRETVTGKLRCECRACGWRGWVDDPWVAATAPDPESTTRAPATVLPLLDVDLEALDRDLAALAAADRDRRQRTPRRRTKLEGQRTPSPAPAAGDTALRRRKKAPSRQAGAATDD